ncbi:NFX1-type zinc finger-containing protein 1 [Papilio xuthus]|uniref:NFX1-type zinc finger-containing protein 1 n=1 Tax=Papilio xuthus TaxID=66420 RepID=A0A0N0PA58_PAPXU|nr:NFX1-type zinc finger-containing protein 1 [Papilio xuthus]
MERFICGGEFSIECKVLLLYLTAKIPLRFPYVIILGIFEVNVYRIICESGHVCTLACAESCAPCSVLVTRRLPCAHDMQLRCHLDITDPSVKCDTIITVVLKNCQHEAKKYCSLDEKFVVCPKPCIYRVEKCGHKCERTCHVDNDPHHEKYVCQKPCAKAKQGCTAGLDGDRGNHQCPKKCHEACDPCVVEVTKKRANCKHAELIACNKSVDDTKCKKKCARSLPCGHFCKKKCFETCGDCTQMVIIHYTYNDYSNTGSDSTLCSNAKLGSGIPLAGTVALSAVNQTNSYQGYRYSNDYTDPAYSECYKGNGFNNGYQTYVHYGHDYTPGSLRVQSPTLSGEKLTPNR